MTTFPRIKTTLYSARYNRTNHVYVHYDPAKNNELTSVNLAGDYMDILPKMDSSARAIITGKLLRALAKSNGGTPS